MNEAGESSSERLKLVADVARESVSRNILPFVEEWEHNRKFPAGELFRKLGSDGLLGLNKPARFGGMEFGYDCHAQMLRALGTIPSGGVSLAITVQTDLATPALATYGSDELRDEFLTPSIGGELVCSLAVTETEAGSNVAGIKTSAIRKGGDYVINGNKCWITNGAQADWYCLLAITDPDYSGSLGLNMGLFCVPADATGVVVERTLDTLGVHASDTAALSFQNVSIPARYVIGNDRKGFMYQMKQFQFERLGLTLASIQSMKITLEKTIEYAKERKLRGQAIFDYQYNRLALAELYCQLRLLDEFADKTVQKVMVGESVQVDVSILKLSCGRLSRVMNDRCMQIWGAMGFSEENFVARKFRDERLLSIGGGADEVMLEIIASSL
ncbi:MAG: acyl-CoA/acyl-ACP dehydrogenase [Pseudomonadales bacterium]|nr:acyl-CoA/acyl-ACP dehydrogenase [Pseudomonadales bacterium]